MRVVELSLRNYRVFEEVDLELPARVIGIFGENGAGKSTLCESVLWALYGRARTSKNEIRTHGLLTDCDVRLVFEHGGSEYEVRRSIRGKSHATDAELFVGDLQLASGVTDVDAEIQRLLRMDQQVFRASVFAEQKQLDAFSDVTTGKRKEMVLRLLGIKPVDDARAAAKKDMRARSENWKQLAGALPAEKELELRLKESKATAAEAKTLAKVSLDELRAARARAAAAETAFDKADRARQQVEQLMAKRVGSLEEREARAAERDDRLERIERLQKELVQLPALEQELESLDGVEARLRSAEQLVDERAKLARAEASLGVPPPTDAETVLGALKAAEDDARLAAEKAAKADADRENEAGRLASAEERLELAAQADPSEPCPTCGRELGADFPAYVKHCKEEVSAAKKDLGVAGRALKQAATALAKAEAWREAAAKVAEQARDAASRRASLEEQAATLRTAIHDLAATFGEEVPDLELLRAGVRRAKELFALVAGLRAEGKYLGQAEVDLAKLEARIADLDASIESMDVRAAELAFDRDRHARIQADRDDAAAGREEAALAERKAADALNDAALAVSGLEGEIKQAKETARRVDELRSEARYLERVSSLLDGFRDHLVARVGPELSREAEALFRELTNAEYDDLRIHEEDLKIEIADGDSYFGIERFSGSETDLANLALRVAISMHLSKMSDADVGMMVLDEVLGSLDAERKDLMVQTLGRLAGRFHQLFVITHAERVKDQFPASIEVRKIARRRSVAELA